MPLFDAAFPRHLVRKIGAARDDESAVGNTRESSGQTQFVGDVRQALPVARSDRAGQKDGACECHAKKLFHASDVRTQGVGVAGIVDSTGR